ncbi:MBL fold metallo-hydrolase [Paracoccus marinaquae]|uniref:MBL fold metallo-hydrolase n=1 Tax=Paracoccus marinaquae TaxID=2841926 RepID=A0ABS6AF75_9RHOB|nr:MBL fold metallo-hydrolase [Paracoccus marinaquae]MBU3029149.1 MBL fold metallo-hydrolase [Paracoccus marinaquae]
MPITRRTGLTLAAAAIGTPFLPRLSGAQDRGRLTWPIEGGEVVFHPVEHASLAIETPGGVIYVDPVGGGGKYAGLPEPALILITHEHGDHFDLPTLEALPPVRLISNPAVHDKLPEAMKTRASAMANGEAVEVLGMTLEAVPAHNTTEDRMQYHPVGRDNGYVLTIGGQRFYVAGDTEPTPEMLGLSDVALAFLPMNLPYTMTVEQAAEAVAAFRPAAVVPYHHRGSDIQEFARLVGEGGSGSEVIIAAWYPGG